MIRHRYIQTLSSLRRTRKSAAFDRAINSTIEPLEARRLFAVTATAAGGVLTVTGDGNANAITVSRDVAGNLSVNNGAIAITGGPASVANIQTINVSGAGGNDNLSLDETNGPLPKASISGGTGNDTLVGGAGADTITGDDGNDALLGKGGNDQLFGGIGNDTLTGGVGTDQAFGQTGNDIMIWNPGDGSDLNEGGDGTDTVIVNGANVTEAFTAIGLDNRVLFQRLDPAPFNIDIGGSEKLVLNANDGDDSFLGATGVAGVLAFTINGGAGNDTLVGTDGADRIDAGAGKDFVDGNAGADLALLGADDDVFRWDPGDGSDTVEGQSGRGDLMLFNGASGNEKVDLSANGNRLRFFRDAGNITMDTNDVEAVTFNALGGADSVTVHNLASTDVRNVELNLEGAPNAGDGQADSVIVEGSNGDDIVSVSGDAGAIEVTGLVPTVSIIGAEPADKLAIKSLRGRDVIIALGLKASAIRFTADGGQGNDLLIGSAGNDTLLGGEGEDFLLGLAGTDALNGGPGNDILIQ